MCRKSQLGQPSDLSGPLNRIRATSVTGNAISFPPGRAWRVHRIRDLAGAQDKDCRKGSHMPDAAPLEPGDPAALEQYQVVGRLGAGGQGAVYLGRSPSGDPVAIK